MPACFRHPAADFSGQAGVGGQVNSHFFSRFGSAILLSILGGAGSLVTGGASTVVVSGGQSAASVAAQHDGNRGPTIKVRQGEPIKHGDIGVHHHGGYNLPRMNISNAAAGCQVIEMEDAQQEFVDLTLKCPRYLADRKGFRLTATVLTAEEVVASMSAPTYLRCSINAATPVVPDPANGSQTT